LTPLCRRTYNLIRLIEEQNLEPIDIARKAVDVASDKQATDILLLDIRRLGTFADFFVILTADNPRLMNALKQDLEDALEQAGAKLHHAEGITDAGWLLLDFGDVIIHLFAPQERAFYHLEDLWAKGQQLVRMQ